MNEEITFHFEEVACPSFFDVKHVLSWIARIAPHYDKKTGFLNFIFCTDEYLLRINQQYLDHDEYTDIITFPYRQDEVIEADIYISLERVEDNAKEYGQSFENELARVMSHGVLHLIGFGDKDDAGVIAMRAAEEEAMAWR